MFGLMKSCTCSQTTDQKELRRLHYCGTCKTIGSLYGQKSRILLNSDAVFLGEVLSAISNSDKRLDQWGRAYQSYNCFSLPHNLEDMPLALQFAATAVLMIAEFKLADRIADSNRTLWKIPQWFLSKSFRAASKRLKQWEFPLAELWQYSHLQGEREAELGRNRTSGAAGESLAYLAEPTAGATGLFFQQGARVVGNQKAQQAMHALGHAFGALVYLLDAFEDYQQDFRNQEFNALRAAYDLSGDRLAVQHREWVVQRLWEIAAEIESALYQLPIAATQAAHFTARLNANLSHRLSGGRPGLNRACRVSARPAMTFRIRSQAAVLIGKTITDTHLGSRSSIFNWIQAPFVFVSALLVALVFPRQAKSVTSYRECMGLPLNLRLLGSVLSPAMAAPFQFSSPSGSGLMMRVGDEESPYLESAPEDKGTSGCGSCCSGCDCGACDCCECCGGCCEC
jgi:hypothetical protein